MYESLGKILRDAREQLGMEQEELATRVGLGQQAISTWERGKSRPRRSTIRAVAEALQVDEETLLDAGGYRASSGDTAPPLRPLTRSLPIDELPPERFEDLVTELMQALYPEGHATLYGGPGEKQFGIDVLIGGANGNLATAQCKRHQQFGPAAVKRAVGQVRINAPKHYLFLSRLTATPGARQEIAKHAGWQLWDGKDISRFIRTTLPLEQAVRLVDAYFPGHREAFLGVPQPAPWLPPEEYFAQARGQIFTHDWLLVGRADEVDRLADVLYRSQGTVAALVGRGGIGKTRLLRAVAEAAPDNATTVRILPSGVPVDACDLELLPISGALVVLIDDAHERDDVAPLVAGIWRRNDRANVLLVTRPYGWNRLRNDLARTTLRPDELVTVELPDLKPADAEALAREALGDVHEAIVQRLAHLTVDCPLATVVGGVLIRRGQLDPAELERDEDVREAIMRGFRDALVSDPLVVDPDTRAAVLDAVAAIQPFRSKEQAFRDALSALAGKPSDVLNKHLRSLEDAGILRRRGASLRVTPDLLGDVILTQACYDEKANVETGYLERVRSVADGQVLQHLFVNVSRVDWQVRRRKEDSPSLVEALWKPLEEEIKQAGIHSREQLVKLLTRVAYFQPARVLRIGRWLIDNPTDQVSAEDAVWSFLHRPTYRDVLNPLPPMLKGGAYTFEHLREALDLLWELAQSDDRPTNQFPDHPMRVLTDLAEFELGKPPVYNEAILEAASRWFADGQTVSPFEVLEPLLATEGSRQTYQDFTLTFHPFSLNAAAVAPIRERVIQLALTEAKATDVRRAVAAVHALESALRYPSGMYGRPVTDEERDRWTPGFLDTIRRLGELASTEGLDPVVIVAIRKTLYWHSSYSDTETQPAAESVVDALPDDLENRIALIVHDGWGHLVRDRDEEYEVTQARIEQRLTDAVTALCEKTDEEIIALINARLSVERAAFRPREGHPGPLLAELVKARPSLASSVLDVIAGGEAIGLEPLLPVVLATYAEHDAAAALERAKQFLDMQSADLKRGVAQALGWNRGMRPLADGELDVILDFAVDPDPVVRRAAAVVAQRLSKPSPTEAGQVVAAIDFSDDPGLADEVFTCFSGRHYGLSWDRLAIAQRDALRRRLVRLSDIDQYWITCFLAERSATDPLWVIKLLQDRVTRAEELESLGDYRAMPFRWDDRLRVREHGDFLSHLRHLHAWIAGSPDSWVRKEMGAEVFQEVAGTYDQTVLALLLEALASPNEADIRAVAAILRKAHRTLIWDSPDFVATALHAAARFGDERRREMANALWGSAISGVMHGTPGQPFPEEVEQRDRSNNVADELPKGSIEHEFYRAIASSAEKSIARSIEEDHDDDGREW